MELTLMDKKQIEKSSIAYLKEYDYDCENDDFVDIVSLVKQSGFSVGNVQLEDADDGFVIIQSEKSSEIQYERLIGVNQNRDIAWKRFIIAHEFAHYALHYKNNQNLFLHRKNTKGKDDDENDADFFAATLLMPYKSFDREYQRLKKDEIPLNLIIGRLSNIFQVPQTSVNRRIEEIKEYRSS